MLNLFRASVAAPGFAVVVEEVGRVVGRVALVVVVDVRDAGVGAGFEAGRPAVVEEAVETVLGREAEGRAEAPATLDLRSKVEGVVVVEGLVGARAEGVPASDMRLTVPEMPRFSSLELATERDFSSAELPLTEARERWEAVLGGLRTGLAVVVEEEEVVGGRVGGLLRVVPEVDVRAPLDGLEADEMEEGRLEPLVEPDKGRLGVAAAVAEADEGLEGEALAFSLLLPSGLVRGPSLPDTPEDWTGVAGGALSASAGGGEATGSEDIVWGVSNSFSSSSFLWGLRSGILDNGGRSSLDGAVATGQSGRGKVVAETRRDPEELQKRLTDLIETDSSAIRTRDQSV